MQAVTDVTFVREVEQNPGWTCVVFTARWCGHCKSVVPLLPMLEERLPEVKFVTMDVEASEDTCKKLKVLNLPTIVLMHDGKFVEVYMNAHGFTVVNMVDGLQKIITTYQNKEKTNGV